MEGTGTCEVKPATGFGGEVATKSEGAIAVKSTRGEREIWRRKFQAMKRKCEEYEELNQTLFLRTKRIHQMIERAEAEKKFLIKNLEQFEVVEFPKMAPKLESQLDSFRPEERREKAGAPPPALLGPFPLSDQAEEDGLASPDEPPPLTIVTNHNGHSHSSHPPPLVKTKHTLSAATGASTSATKQKRTVKSVVEKDSSGSRRKKDVDPNAPKRPSNSFFWFCQEHRPGLQSRFEGKGVAGQHELTKVMAKMWSEITPDDKKRYQMMYAEDKSRYDREMQEYAVRGQQQQFAKFGLSEASTVTTT